MFPWSGGECQENAWSCRHFVVDANRDKDKHVNAVRKQRKRKSTQQPERETKERKGERKIEKRERQREYERKGARCVHNNGDTVVRSADAFGDVVDLLSDAVHKFLGRPRRREVQQSFGTVRNTTISTAAAPCGRLVWEKETRERKIYRNRGRGEEERRGGRGAYTEAAAIATAAGRMACELRLRVGGAATGGVAACGDVSGSEGYREWCRAEKPYQQPTPHNSIQTQHTYMQAPQKSTIAVDILARGVVSIHVPINFPFPFPAVILIRNASSLG